jgi:hypothetical protein
MRPLPTKTGLPRLDRESWDKGFSDGFRGHKWWPGPGTEPLSYASGYTAALEPRSEPKMDPQAPNAGSAAALESKA